MEAARRAIDRKTDAALQVHTMPFGQHKGEPLDTLPDDYLLWVSTLNDLRQPLLGHVLREMGRRLAEQQPVTAEEAAR